MPQSGEFCHTIREASPDLIVNNRVAKRSRFQLDCVTQEQHFATEFPNHWEGCYRDLTLDEGPSPPARSR